MKSCNRGTALARSLYPELRKKKEVPSKGDSPYYDFVKIDDVIEEATREISSSACNHSQVEYNWYKSKYTCLDCKYEVSLQQVVSYQSTHSEPHPIRKHRPKAKGV